MGEDNRRERQCRGGGAGRSSSRQREEHVEETWGLGGMTKGGRPDALTEDEMRAEMCRGLEGGASLAGPETRRWRVGIGGAGAGGCWGWGTPGLGVAGDGARWG